MTGPVPPLRVIRLTPADYHAMPWANGRGTTLELYRREDASGALLLRLSIADVVEAGAFSALPGIDRILTLIEGDGFDLDLRPHGALRPLMPFVPVAFSGDWPTAALNVRGPSRDFNVMAARAAYEADVDALESGACACLLEGPTCLYAAEGPVQLTVGASLWALEPGDLAVIEPGTAAMARIEVAGRALLVRVMAKA